jgi:hypothetical protein
MKGFGFMESNFDIFLSRKLCKHAALYKYKYNIKIKAGILGQWLNVNTDSVN